MILENECSQNSLLTLLLLKKKDGHDIHHFQTNASKTFAAVCPDGGTNYCCKLLLQFSFCYTLFPTHFHINLVECWNKSSNPIKESCNTFSIVHCKKAALKLVVVRAKNVFETRHWTSLWRPHVAFLSLCSYCFFIMVLKTLSLKSFAITYTYKLGSFQAVPAPLLLMYQYIQHQYVNCWRQTLVTKISRASIKKKKYVVDTDRFDIVFELTIIPPLLIGVTSSNPK